MARKTGQIVGRGRHRWLVRVFLGRDRETRRRRNLGRTVHGPVREAQTYLNKVLRERDLGRRVVGIAITLNEYLNRWLETAAKPKLREKSYQSYESLLRRYIRLALGERMLSAICPLDVQDVYQKMIDHGLSSRTIRYTHSVLRSAMRQAIRWRLLAQGAVPATTSRSSCLNPALRLRTKPLLAASEYVRTISKLWHSAYFCIAVDWFSVEYC